MALKDEIIPYVDGNGLTSPCLVPPGTIRACDNGSMFTSEHYIILSMLGQLNEQDRDDFVAKISSCVGSDGELHRAPNDPSPDEVDDHYATYSGLKTLGLKPSFKLPVRLWRQPQLLAASIATRFPSFSNPLHLFIRLLTMPLFLIAALVIATSCIGVDPGNTDARRLSWHLQQTLKPVSLSCWIASKIWLRRLYGDYGPTGMRAVAEIYYEKGHPFAKYWVTE